MSEYVGIGVMAQCLAAVDAMAREREEARRQAARARQAKDRELDRQLDIFDRQVRQVHRYVMLVSGYHTSKRKWRMSREVTLRPDMLSKEETAQLEQLNFPDLLSRVDTEDPSRRDIVALQNIIDQVPTVISELIGLGAVVRTGLLQKFVDQRSMQVAVHAEIAMMRRKLGYARADGLEQLLIENIILSWLRLQHVEALLTNSSADNASYYDGRLNAAQRRYLRACTTLARVRKLSEGRIVINNKADTINQLNQLGRSRQ